MNIEQIAMDCLDVNEETLQTSSMELKEIDAWYYSNPMRGGLSMIINRDGEKLVANSSISFQQHYSDFCQGKRN